nr:hypothetical protein OG409_03745 [Streptomyces sp. NBC_00974]
MPSVDDLMVADGTRSAGAGRRLAAHLVERAREAFHFAAQLT